MNATGNIIADTTYGPLESKMKRYRWDGGRVASISGFYYDVPLIAGGRFRIGPFRLRVIEACLWTNSVYVIQEPGIINRLFYFIYRVTPILEKIYRRLIVTAYVWGCASYEPRTIPGWHDLCLPWRKRK